MQQDPQICRTEEDWPETSKKSKFITMMPVPNSSLQPPIIIF